MSETCKLIVESSVRAKITIKYRTCVLFGAFDRVHARKCIDIYRYYREQTDKNSDAFGRVYMYRADQSILILRWLIYHRKYRS